MNKKLSFRILLFLLCAALMLPLVGCQTTPDPVETDPVTDPVTDPATDPKTDPETAPETDPETEPETEPEDKDTMWTYTHEAGGMLVRNITIKTDKGGDPIEIIQATDIHVNYLNDRDLAGDQDVINIANSYWLANGASLPGIQRVLNLAKDADQLVVTGDLMSYIGYGCLEFLDEHLFTDEFEGRIMASLGNHETYAGRSGTEAEVKAYIERIAQVWPNDPTYSSKVLGEKVMLIQMDNASSTDIPGVGTCFYQEQVSLLRADLETAREKGYVVLLFYHIPIATGNPKDYRSISPYNGEQANFYSSGVGRYSTGASKEIYTLITENADIIKGAFCGHVHNDYYTNIKGTGQNGTGHLIPQYIVRCNPYENGHTFRIIVE
ncbi:MAG: metallophosphoesterase [Clostridia bacterium]|nr:metallophosphoesterase [Clostridia bacterium]